MKKILLILAMAASMIVGCKPKDNAPTPAVPVADSIKINTSKVSGDTIRTFSTPTAGTFAVNFAAFQNNAAISGQSVTVNLKALDQPGTFKYNNAQVVNQVITQGSNFNFEYVPVNVIGKQRIVISATAGGKTFTDTTWFYVKTYQPVPYSVVYSSKSFPSQSPTSTFGFTMNINTTDVSNTIDYSYKIGYLILPPSSSGTVLLKDNNNNAFVNVGQSYAFSTGTVQSLTMNLTAASTGTYKLPIEVSDTNGDIRRDTITFVVQ